MELEPPKSKPTITLPSRAGNSASGTTHAFQSAREQFISRAGLCGRFKSNALKVRLVRWRCQYPPRFVLHVRQGLDAAGQPRISRVPRRPIVNPTILRCLKNVYDRRPITAPLYHLLRERRITKDRD